MHGLTGFQVKARLDEQTEVWELSSTMSLLVTQQPDQI